ncbi:MAG: ribonuclease III [Deltaproteobacteria bacterium]|nr:ribonuclease III [Deltaproteobacteria bacterium]
MLTGDSTEVERLQDALGYRFRDPGLLKRCLTHVSCGGGMDAHNESLEFLGDAVLGLAISDLLMRRFPERSEGDLSRMRASLVNRRVLADKARFLRIGEVLRVGKGEERTGGRHKESILAASFEALLGGIYWEAGYEAVRPVVESHFIGDLEHGGLGLDDYKTRLQEVSQRLYRVPPTYRLVRESGPSHDRYFETEIRVGGHLVGQGEGRSKKQSEQEAARRALEMLQGQGQQ